MHQIQELQIEMTFINIAAIVGGSLVTGLLFAFSNFVMRALADVPNEEGMLVMQRINERIINPLFVLLFIGTPVLCGIIAVRSITDLNAPRSLVSFLGAILYLIGPFGITMLFNVPLNNRLAKSQISEADEVWPDYQVRWQRWNHVRTYVGIIAIALLAAGLGQQDVSAKHEPSNDTAESPNATPQSPQTRFVEALGEFTLDEEEMWGGRVDLDGEQVNVFLHAFETDFDTLSAYAKRVLARRPLPDQQMREDISRGIKSMAWKFEDFGFDESQVDLERFRVERLVIGKNFDGPEIELTINLRYPADANSWLLSYFNEGARGSLNWIPKAED